jgi:branched-subunit amino acid transport protein AzlD
VFTARYALSPYIKQIRFVFKGLIASVLFVSCFKSVKIRDLTMVSVEVAVVGFVCRHAIWWTGVQVSEKLDASIFCVRDSFTKW